VTTTRPDEGANGDGRRRDPQPAAVCSPNASDRQQAAAHFDDVVRLQADLALPLARAQALTACGVFWNRCRDARRARPILAEGATHRPRLRGWLARPASPRRMAPSRRSRRRRCPDQRTPQEAAVVRLARGGRTNREIAQELFPSVNTVEMHLAHAFRKLDVRRRWELIARDDDH
jgi:DNA-binding CsgD family transcriptional regulator